ncbi:MAG TPA: site-2 protease family protein [Candidatus Paceibacterota bacterium]|nr:site-2 protease family protein [Candidatus Paceibacterota bacterium]
MLTALIFIIVIGVLVLVHEFGHFIFAKKAGMKVEEFGFGFPPRLWGIKKGETTYSINWIPFGGFVKILGEDGDERGPRSFASGSFGQRILVIVAGVLMNILLAAVFLVIVNFFGLRVGISEQEAAGYQDLKIQIVEVSAGSPAAAAGLQPLDEIRGYADGGTFYAIHTTEELQNLTAQRQGQPITLELTRGATDIEKTLTPRANPPAGQGALGISLAMTGLVHYPWYESIWRGFYDTGIIIINTVLGYYYLLKTLIIHGTLIAEVSGPIGIAGLTGQAARIGITYLLQFVALISVNLAVLNIIPFPALDGGRALMLIIEKIKGSPIHRKTEMVINMAGFYLLIALMVYITYKDISKFF